MQLDEPTPEDTKILATFPSVTNVINSTHTELNIVDGDTSATATTLVDADRIVVNDDGKMDIVAATSQGVAVYQGHERGLSLLDAESPITIPIETGTDFVVVDDLDGSGGAPDRNE